MSGEVVTAIAAVVAAVVSCLGMMGWLLGMWNAEAGAIRERRASDAVSFAMVSSYAWREEGEVVSRKRELKYGWGTTYCYEL
jgi:hypothetical protein